MRAIPMLAVALAAAAAAGCAAYSDDGELPRATEDAGPVGGGATDAGAPVPAEPDPANGLLADDDGDAPSAGAGRNGESLDADSAFGSGSLATCFDNVDNDGVGGVDCDDPMCIGLRSCCVGHADCCAAVAQPALPPAVTFSTCEERDGAASPATCLGTDERPVVEFGDPSPKIVGGELYPQGDDTFDSGFYFARPVDLSTRTVDLETTFVRPSGCGSSCIESVGVGFTHQGTFDETTLVRPAIGLLMSGSLRDVMLLVAGDVVARWPLGEDDASWRLIARPDGELRVFRDGVEQLGPGDRAFRFLPGPDARLVVYGRNRNVADTVTGARVGDITIATSLCDVVDRWPTRKPVAVVGEGSAGTAAGQPSIAYGDDDMPYLAWEADVDGMPGIRFGRRSSIEEVADPARFAPFVNDEARIGTGGGPHSEGGAFEPDLVWDGQKLQVVYTAHSAGGVSSIGRARLRPTDGLTLEAERLVLDPGGHADVTGFDGPTLFRHWSGTWVLIARAHLTGGGHELRVYRTDDIEGDVWTEIPDTQLREVLTTGRQEAEGFDAREVAAPSLTIHNGAWHLYYARRIGARWSIGLIASDDLLYWRHVDRGYPVLEDGPNAFERLGASGPDVAVYPGSDEVELVYEGQDGTRPRMGFASRPSPDEGQRPLP